MFLRKTVLTRLIKKTFKSGLKIASDGGWLYLGGDYWECKIKQSFVPKEVAGEIIKMIGMLPEEGEKWLCTPCEKQMEFSIATDINTGDFSTGVLAVTNTLQLGTEDVVQRFVQDEDTGEIYLINNVFADLVSELEMEWHRGESAIDGPFYGPAGVLWKNNVCELHALFRFDEKNNKVLSQLKGVNLL